MRKFENYITLKNLEHAREIIVPTLFTENYYDILKAKLKGDKLSINEQYYFNHFIKKKLEGMIELLGVETMVQGKECIRKDRLQKAKMILKKYSRKHKNMKILISGSFLYAEKYNDIDIFVISKYDKVDYQDGKVHINYLPNDIEKTLFFHSLYDISAANFTSDAPIDEKISLADILRLYELVILLIIQRDNYLQELRDLALKLEYMSNNVILNPIQLHTITKKIMKNKNPILIINKYLIPKIINSYNRAHIKNTLNEFIEKNSHPEKGHNIYENWKIYNQTYKEAMAIVA